MAMQALVASPLRWKGIHDVIRASSRLAAPGRSPFRSVSLSLQACQSLVRMESGTFLLEKTICPL